MKTRYLTIFAVGLILHLSGKAAAADHSGGSSGDAASYEIIHIGPEPGGYDAALFMSEGVQIVIFVPGAVFDKESWYFLAQRFHELNVASLALDGKTERDVLAAVEAAKKRGFRKVILVGGSMGGAAVLEALDASQDGCLAKAILLAPAGGTPIKSERIDKLFVVAKEDRLGLYAPVKALYEQSSEPKRFAAIDGDAHAQHLFKTSARARVADLIVQFVLSEE